MEAAADSTEGKHLSTVSEAKLSAALGLLLPGLCWQLQEKDWVDMDGGLLGSLGED